MKPRIAIVWAHFRPQITQRMKDYAIQYVKEFGGEVVDEACVRGSFEIPFMTQKMLQRKDVDAVVTLGCVIRGETRHDEVICLSVANKLLDLSCRYEKPVSLGIMGPGVMKEKAEARVRGYALAAAEGAVSSVLIQKSKSFEFKERRH